MLNGCTSQPPSEKAEAEGTGGSGAAGGNGATGGSGAADGTLGVTSGGGGSSAASAGGMGSGEERHFFGATEIPGLNPSGCEGPVPERTFEPSSEVINAPGPYLVLTLAFPAEIEGSAVANVTVNGSSRGVRRDTQRDAWTFFLAGASGDYTVTATAQSGATRSLLLPVTIGAQPLPARDIEYHHSLGTWMYTGFRGDDEWRCRSPWRPVDGFASWDGSVAWARQQLLDQVDAHLDLVGLQLNTRMPSGDEGYRFSNLLNVLQAARDLLDEGIFPPRLFPLLDPAAMAERRAQGSALNLATEGERAEFYAHAQAFYDAAHASFGEGYFRAAVAHFYGEPSVAVGEAGVVLSTDESAVDDFKARFLAEYGVDCFFIAHPESWPATASVDERTPMFGGPTHQLQITSEDQLPTITLTPGYWDPVGEPFYLPRDAGAPYLAAWQEALAERTAVSHLWLGSWNEPTSGSGIFAADPVNNIASDVATCGEPESPHADVWGPNSRHYIDITREQARAWSNEPDFDAMPVASDLPVRLRPGERRYVTVAMRNTGDALWTPEHHKLGITFSAAAREFRLDALGALQSDAVVERFGGVARGMTGVFSVLLTAPCQPGDHLVAFEIYDSQLGGFGSQLQQIVSVE